MTPDLEIHDRHEAITAYAEVWAWAKLASVFAEGVATGRYPDNQKLAQVVLEDWRERIYPISKALAVWLRQPEQED